MELTDRQRKHKDVHDFVERLLAEQENGKAKYRYEFVLEKARQRFYLSPRTIEDIHRNYTPPPVDPMQLAMDLEPKKDNTTTGDQKAA